MRNVTEPADRHLRSMLILTSLLLFVLSFTQSSGAEQKAVHVDTKEYCMTAGDVAVTLSQIRDLDENALRDLITEKADPKIRVRADWSIWKGEYDSVDVSRIRPAAEQGGYEVIFTLPGSDDEIDQFAVMVYVEDDTGEQEDPQPQPKPPKAESSEGDGAEQLKSAEATAPQADAVLKEAETEAEDTAAIAEAPAKAACDEENTCGKQECSRIDLIAAIFFVLTGLTLAAGGATLYSDLKLLRWCGWKWRR